MLKIGIIGAGSISKWHIKSYLAHPECEVVAITDKNSEQAAATAAEFGIGKVYATSDELLLDSNIDAVSIATPTFTHKDIAIAAIKAGKHILCEKPPALNADEVREIKAALEGTNKVFMFAMVCRFLNKFKCIKEYIDTGKMGKFICAEVARTARMSKSSGWFAKSSLGGGILRDAAIHEIDMVLYAMGYPRAKSVTAFASHLNNDLPSKLKSGVGGYVSADKNVYKSDVEDIIKAFVTLDNGANLFIKTGCVYLTPREERFIEICGERAGVMFDEASSGPELPFVEITDDYEMRESGIEVAKNDPFTDEIAHFIDCCNGKTECIIKIDEAIKLMELIDAVYESAKTGETVIIK